MVETQLEINDYGKSYGATDSMVEVKGQQLPKRVMEKTFTHGATWAYFVLWTKPTKLGHTCATWAYNYC